MSIPEVDSKPRLIAFLNKFFNKSAQLLPSGYAPSMSPTPPATSIQKLMRTVDGVTPTTPGHPGGYRMMVSGYIVGVSCQFSCTAHSSDTTVRATVVRNGSNTTAFTELNVTATGVTGSSATTRKYRFEADDLLEVRLSHASTGITTENHACLIRIVTTTE